MKPVESMLIRLAGYTPSTVEADSHEERELLVKLGGPILFATSLAASVWATSGWVYSEGAPVPIRIAISTVCAAFGGSIVFLCDRTFIYLSDTSLAKGSAKVLTYAALRVCIILLVGGITGQAVMPLILSKELAVHALYLTEQSEAARMSKLSTQYDLGSKKTAVEDATSEVKKLETAISTIPPEIKQKLTAARACWADYTTRRRELVSDGFSDAKAREQLAWEADECNRKIRTAKSEQDAYIKRTQAQLNAAVTIKTQATTAFSDANTIIKGKLKRASDIEEEAISPRSSSVLYSLLRSDPGACIKWAFYTMLILFLELLPLLLKLQAGQSSIGHRIANGRAIRIRQSDELLDTAERDATVTAATTRITKLAIGHVEANPEYRAKFAQVFAAYLIAFAPTQAVQSMMHEFSTHQYDVNEFMQRFPKYAPVIAQAWPKAIRETAEILARGIRGGPIFDNGQPI